MKRIESLTNKNIKFYTKLQNDKKFRDEKNMFVCESEKIIDQLIKSKFKIASLFIREDLLSNSKIKSLINKCDVFIINKNISKKLSIFKSDSGIYAVCEKNRKKEWDVNRSGFYLFLDGIQDPGNIGTIIRTALAFNFQGIFISSNAIDLYNPKTIRYTMGSIFEIPTYIVKDQNEFINFIKNKKISIYSTTLSKDSIQLREIKLNNNRNLLIMGSEGHGINHQLIEKSDYQIKIPFNETINSLNVAIAFGIIAYRFNEIWKK